MKHNNSFLHRMINSRTVYMVRYLLIIPVLFTGCTEDLEDPDQKMFEATRPYHESEALTYSIESDTTLHFNSENVLINNIDDYMVINPTSWPELDRFYIVARNQGNLKANKATWDMGATTGFYPSGWDQPDNNVKRSKLDTWSSGMQASGTTIGWITDAGDNDPFVGSAGNSFNSIDYKFSNATWPKPWTYASGKIQLRTRMKMNKTEFSSGLIQHGKFELFIRNVGQNRGFFWQDKFFHEGSNPPSDQVAHVDSATGAIIAISKHTNASTFHTRSSGTFQSDEFPMTVFEITISRSELEAAIDMINEKIISENLSMPTLNKEWGDYAITSINVNTEMKVDGATGYSGLLVDHMSISTIRDHRFSDNFERVETNWVNETVTTNPINNNWQVLRGKWRIADPGGDGASGNWAESDIEGNANLLMIDTVGITQSGLGDIFTVSADVMVPSTADPAWAGIVFNVQDENNYYALRLNGTGKIQVIRMLNGVASAILTDLTHTSELVGENFYHLEISSDTAYTFDFSIKSLGGTIIAQGTAVDSGSYFNSGYSGLYAVSDGVYDNFSLTSSSL